MKKAMLILLVAVAAVSLFVSCKNEPEVKTYKVGETGPAGGIVFYVNQNAEKDGWTYLEVAPADLEGTYLWGSDGVYGTSQEVGKGKSNTEKLLAAKTEKSSLSFPAAEACNSYSQGDKTDWFLPSVEELKLLYKYCSETGKGSFTAERYWSSSEEEDMNSNSYFVYSSSGTANSWGRNFENGKCSVRPIRSFN